MQKESIYGLTREQLVDWFLAHGEKKFRATQVWEWLYTKRVASFSEMSNISKSLMTLLEENFSLNPLKQVIVQEAQDGTVKYLFELPDKNMIETVLMRQEYGLSVCVTTQVGCNIGCTFCASGLLKKQRDLTAGANVMNFLRTINDDKGLAIGARHITVSTSGLVPKIREFADSGLQVNLAISLHAPNNEVRTSIMRINRSFPIEKLMAAIDEYIEKTNRRVTFEYIMLSQVNDRPEHAQQLADLLRNKKKLSYVNLIPYNPVSEHDQYSRSSKEAVLKFYDVLKKNGINCVIRKEHGTDIDAACGQLRSKQMKKEKVKNQ